MVTVLAAQQEGDRLGNGTVAANTQFLGGVIEGKNLQSAVSSVAYRHLFDREHIDGADEDEAIETLATLVASDFSE